MNPRSVFAVALRRRRGVLHSFFSATSSQSYVRNVVAFLCFLLATNARADDATKQVPALPEDTLPEEIDLDAARTILHARGYDTGDNSLTQPRVDLGRRLFFDPILSKDQTVSCASCHQPNHGFASPDPKAIGIRGQIGRRNAPTLLNRAFGKSHFWDGRAASLEEQSLQPISHPQEMNHRVEQVIEDLRNDQEYLQLFRVAFTESDEATPGTDGDYVTAENLATSLASFQRTLLTGETPVDRFQSGDYRALSDDERQGLWIFESRGRCWKCHRGHNYTDESFHNLGVGFEDEGKDRGRFETTSDDADMRRFKTPTLRAIKLTAPYMHNGSLKTLEEVVAFYNVGGGTTDPLLDRKVQPLGLSEKEILQLVAFLESLSR